jgi:Ca2+-binding RTX toxin-like protein
VCHYESYEGNLTNATRTSWLMSGEVELRDRDGVIATSIRLENVPVYDRSTVISSGQTVSEDVVQPLQITPDAPLLPIQIVPVDTPVPVQPAPQNIPNPSALFAPDITAPTDPLSVIVNTAQLLTTDLLNLSDSDSADDDVFLRLVDAPEQGFIGAGGILVQEGEHFTLAQLKADAVIYGHLSDAPIDADSFTLQVFDRDAQAALVSNGNAVTAGDGLVTVDVDIDVGSPPALTVTAPRADFANGAPARIEVVADAPVVGDQYIILEITGPSAALFGDVFPGVRIPDGYDRGYIELIPNGTITPGLDAVTVSVSNASRGVDISAAGSVSLNAVAVLDNDEVLSGSGAADYLVGGFGDDVLNGLKGRDLLLGGIGNDRLLGAKGADDLRGGSGIDILRGGDGADVLDGGAGDDTIAGGAGADQLTGGVGSDLFLFALNEGQDAITDFQLEFDKIKLIGATFADVNVSNDGADTLITLGTGSVRLLDVTVESDPFATLFV